MPGTQISLFYIIAEVLDSNLNSSYDFKGSELSPHTFGPTGKFSQGATQTHECLPLTFWSWLMCALLLCKLGRPTAPAPSEYLPGCLELPLP